MKVILLMSMMLGFVAFAFTQGIVVNEVMSNVRGTDSGAGSPGDRNEFVELFNGTDSTMDLSSYRISDLDADDTIEPWSDSLLLDTDVVFGTTLLEPGAYAVILDPEYTETGNGSYYQPYDFPEQTLIVTIGNTTIGDGLSATDPIVLIDASDDTVSSYGTPQEQNDGVPFDPGDGISAERISPYVADHELNWIACSDSSNCTPGGPNSTYGASELALPHHGFLVNPVHVEANEQVTISALIQNQTEDTVKTARINFFVDKEWDSLCTPNELIETIMLAEPIPPYGCSTRIEIVWVPEETGNMRLAAKLNAHEKAACFRMLKVGEPVGEIIINEIMYRPDGGGEWVELHNRSVFPIDISKWHLGVGDERIVIGGMHSVIEPGSYLVIVEDRSQFYTKWGNVPAEVIELSGWMPLSNGGDMLVVDDGDAFEFERVQYDDIAEAGESIERISPDAGSNEEWNWGCSVDYRGGTPGERNSIFAESSKGKALLSVSPNPFSPDGDGNEERAYIRYALPFLQARINLLLYTRTGVRKCVFMDNRESGKTGEFIWDGCDDEGKAMPVGLYIVFLEAVDSASHERIVKKAAVVIAGRR